jgi:ribonuclease Z
VLAECNPRLAVAFHFFNDFDTAPEMEREIRKHYKGPLALAKDLMVFNVTKERIVSRMAVTSSHVWPNKEHHNDFRKAERKERMKMSKWLSEKQVFPKF